MMMMMTTNSILYDLYQKALSSDTEDKSYRAVKIDDKIPHRVGCSNEGFPMLFIECKDRQYVSDIKLSLFRVLFNRKCSIVDIDNKSIIEKDFTIIQMTSDSQDLIKYFFQVIYIVMQRIPIFPTVGLLKIEISKIIEIFTAIPRFSKETVRGLWAELLVIEQSHDPNYLIKAWHEEPEDRYDFNDSIDKIEVKSTTGDIRTHIFSLEQLSPSDGSNLIIASVFVNATGIGKSIFDLMDMISTKIQSTDCELKLSEIVLKTIGPHIEECKNICFDYKFAVETIKYFSSTIIPSISKEDVPVEVSAIHFRSNLTGIPSIEETGYNENSKLFNCL